MKRTQTHVYVQCFSWIDLARVLLWRWGSAGGVDLNSPPSKTIESLRKLLVASQKPLEPPKVFGRLLESSGNSQGFCFFSGGWVQKHNHFNERARSTGNCLLSPTGGSYFKPSGSKPHSFRSIWGSAGLWFWPRDPRPRIFYFLGKNHFWDKYWEFSYVPQKQSLTHADHIRKPCLEKNLSDVFLMWVTQQRKTRQTTDHIRKWWGFSPPRKKTFRTSIGNGFLDFLMWVESGQEDVHEVEIVGHPSSSGPRELGGTQKPQVPVSEIRTH